MANRTNTLSIIYIGLAVLAGVACWRQNLLFMFEAEIDFLTLFVAFWPALFVNHASTSITIDIFLLCVSAMTWMVLEARRLGIRYVWAYVLLSFPIAISVTFPLFLAARERALASGSVPGGGLTIGDKIGLGIIGAAGVALALWTFMP